MRAKSDPTKKEVRQRMLASGRWKEGPDGSLLRVQAGVPTKERAMELERLDRPMTEQEAREYALRAFDPSAGPNVLFSLIAGAHPAAAAVDIGGQALTLGAKAATPLAKEAIPLEMWEPIVKRANELLSEGFGIKKGDASIELIPKEVDVTGSSFPGFDLEVAIDGKKTGFMSFEPMTDYDAQMIQNQRTLGLGEETPMEYGVIRMDDFPFGEGGGPEMGMGYSAEMNKALNEALKEKGYRMFSSTSHSDLGGARYMADVERRVVDPIFSTRTSPVPRDERRLKELLDRYPGAEIKGDMLHIPETRYRYNREGGRVGDSWPPDNDIYARDQQIAYANMLQQLAADYDAAQARLDQGEIGPTPTYPNLSPYPTIQATELSPELREERGRSNPGFQLLDLLTPVGDVTQIAQGIGDMITGDPAMGGVNIGAGLLSLGIPGGIRTGKASSKLAEQAGKKGVSVKAIKQAASGKDVSASEASLLNMFAERAEKAGMTHVDPGNMQMGGMERLPRFRGANTSPEWDEFFGTDRLMGLDYYNPSTVDQAIREARSEIIRDADVILLRGDESVYGKGSSKHFYGDRGEGYVPSVEDLESPKAGREPLRGVGVHAHVRALPDPWEATKAKRGEPSRNVRTMLEIQSDAFQANQRGRWQNTYDYGDEPIHGSMEMNRMAAEDPGRIDEIFNNIEHVGKQVIGYLSDKGFKKGESLQDALGLDKVPAGHGQRQYKDVGLLKDYGGVSVASPEGAVQGFERLLQDLIDAGDITRKEADDFLVGYSRLGGEGHYDFNFSENVTDAEARGRRMGMADDFDVEAERPNVTKEHPWIRVTSELVDIGVKQMRREVKDVDFLKHVENVKLMPDPANNPMSKTWAREALAAFFEDGASKGAEAYRIPTPETVRTIQGWGEEGEFDMILGRYKGLPDQMKKMGVDVSKITPVTDGFGNTWLELPRNAVPEAVKVFKRGGRLNVKKAKKGMRVKRCI
jgi:hypothetical protein|tara:strand:+ start:2212 stop:5145 length:2934 start_codon:yes stop_codon:yes gene_type:complete